MLGRQNLIQMQIVAIAHILAEIELGFFVLDDGCAAAMHGAAGGFGSHGQLFMSELICAA